MRRIFAFIIACSTLSLAPVLHPNRAVALDCTQSYPNQTAAEAALTKVESITGNTFSSVLTRLKLLANADDQEHKADRAMDSECIGESISNLVLRSWTAALFERELPNLLRIAPPKSPDCLRLAEKRRDANLAEAYYVLTAFTDGASSKFPRSIAAYRAVTETANNAQLALPSFTNSYDEQGKLQAKAFQTSTKTQYESFKATMTDTCAFKGSLVPKGAVIIFFGPQ